MPSLGSFAQRVALEVPDAKISEIRVIGFGDRDAIVSVRASRQHDLAPRGASLVMNFRAVTSEVLFVRRLDNMGIFERFNTAMIALHVADFDKPAIRTLYAAASVVLALLPILGVVMWVLRRRDRLLASCVRARRATR